MVFRCCCLLFHSYVCLFQYNVPAWGQGEQTQLTAQCCGLSACSPTPVTASDSELPERRPLRQPGSIQVPSGLGGLRPAPPGPPCSHCCPDRPLFSLIIVFLVIFMVSLVIHVGGRATQEADGRARNKGNFRPSFSGLLNSKSPYFHDKAPSEAPMDNSVVCIKSV